MPLTLSHTGICVTDLARSIRFYEQVLGAVVLDRVDLTAKMPPDYRGLLEIPEDTHATCTFLGVNGRLMELLHYLDDSGEPDFSGPGERRPMNQLGLTHLSFRTPDRAEFEAVIERVREHGGKVVEESRFIIPDRNGHRIDVVFCTDPDGTRLEFMLSPDAHQIQQ